MRAVLLGSHNAQCIDVADRDSTFVVPTGRFVFYGEGARCATTLSVREKMVHTSKGALLGSDIQSHAAPRDMIGRPRSPLSGVGGGARAPASPLLHRPSRYPRGFAHLSSLAHQSLPRDVAPLARK